MMDPNTAGGGRRGRKRRNRSGPPTGSDNRNQDGRRRKKRKKPRSNSHGGRSQARHSGLEPVKDNGSVLGQRVPQKRTQRQPTDGPPDAFALFCSYYLGVTVEDGYQKPTLDNTARRYGMPPEEIKNLLTQYDLDPDSMSRTDFDLEGAKLDVRLAPEGMSRTEIARDHFESYLACVED